jgi:hypothetical protein
VPFISQDHPDSYFEGARYPRGLNKGSFPEDPEYSGFAIATGLAISLAVSAAFLPRVGLEFASDALQRARTKTRESLTAIGESFSTGFLETAVKRTVSESSAVEAEVPGIIPRPTVLSALGAEAWAGYDSAIPGISSQGAPTLRGDRTSAEDAL